MHSVAVKTPLINDVTSGRGCECTLKKVDDNTNDERFIRTPKFEEIHMNDYETLGSTRFGQYFIDSVLVP